MNNIGSWFKKIFSSVESTKQEQENLVVKEPIQFD